MRSSRSIRGEFVTKWVPSRDPSSQPEKPDFEYAEAYDLIASAISECKNNEDAVALRLSTCRNAYLTANALFVDLRVVLGHGKTPSLLSSAIELGRRKDLKGSGNLIHKIKATLAEVRSKQDVWNRREELDAVFYAQVQLLKPLQRDRIKRALENVRIQDKNTNQLWSRDYYAKSLEEPFLAREALETLAHAFVQVYSMAVVAESILDTQDIDDLFGTRGANAWLHLYSKLVEHASTLNIGVSKAGEVNWPDLSGTPVSMRENYPGEPEAWKTCLSLLDHLEQEERELYESINRSFTPNIATPPLPNPFQIVFRDRVPIGVSGNLATPQVRTRSFDVDVPRQLRVALPGYGVPDNFYREENKTYADDSTRQSVTRLVEMSIRSAAAQKAKVIVFPEYFLPRDQVFPIQKIATELDIVVIGGLEGHISRTETPTLVNDAIIVFPGLDQPFTQRKFRASNMETPFETEADDFLLHFDHTAIGSFSVLVCSDYREFDIIAALAAKIRRFHMLFVVSNNRHVELFEAYALADACRLQCHVVICNNCASGNGTASSRGSVICTPKSKPADRVRNTFDSVPVGGPEVGGEAPTLLFCDLDLESVAADSPKPPDGFLPPPKCRLKSTSAN